MEEKVKQRRWRQPVAAILVLSWLLIYCLLVMELGNLMINVHALLIWPFYLVAGIVWVFPCKYIFKWSAQDPLNEVSNRVAESKFK